MVPFVLGTQDAWAQLTHLKRWLDEINFRPAAQRAEALKARHGFKAEMDDDARRALFPQNERLAGWTARCRLRAPAHAGRSLTRLKASARFN